MIIEQGKVYLMNDAYWLCVSDDPDDMRWEKVQDNKKVIHAPSCSYTDVEVNTHEVD